MDFMMIVHFWHPCIFHCIFLISISMPILNKDARMNNETFEKRSITAACTSTEAPPTELVPVVHENRAYVLKNPQRLCQIPKGSGVFRDLLIFHFVENSQADFNRQCIQRHDRTTMKRI